VRLIIAGSRGFNCYPTLALAMFRLGLRPDVIISGTARGADQLGEQYGACFGIPVERFPADWDRHGKRAGYLRNVQMAESADTLLAFWDGSSQGTAHMIDIARERGLTAHVWRI
jgi:hypothetical protein